MKIKNKTSKIAFLSIIIFILFIQCGSENGYYDDRHIKTWKGTIVSMNMDPFGLIPRAKGPFKLAAVGLALVQSVSNDNEYIRVSTAPEMGDKFEIVDYDWFYIHTIGDTVTFHEVRKEEIFTKNGGASK